MTKKRRVQKETVVWRKYSPHATYYGWHARYRGAWLHVYRPYGRVWFAFVKRSGSVARETIRKSRQAAMNAAIDLAIGEANR